MESKEESDDNDEQKMAEDAHDDLLASVNSLAPLTANGHSLHDKDEEEADDSEQDIDALVRQAQQAIVTRLQHQHSGADPGTLASSAAAASSSSSSSSPPSSSSSSLPHGTVPAFLTAALAPPPLFTKQQRGIVDISAAAADSLPAVPTASGAAAAAAASSSSSSSSASSWFSLPTPTLTPELKRDLRLLSLRAYLDPKRFYKRGDRKPGRLPSAFHVGRVVEGAAEWWSARESRRERRQWLAEAVKEEGGAWLQRRFDAAQESRQRGKFRGKKTLTSRGRKRR